MSAFMTSRELRVDLALLAAYFEKMLRIPENSILAGPLAEDAAKSFKDLTAANRKSLRARYSDGRTMYDLREDPPTEMEAQRLIHLMRARGTGALHQWSQDSACFDYQSCEFKGWNRSKVRMQILELRDRLLSLLTSRDAKWGR